MDSVQDKDYYDKTVDYKKQKIQRIESQIKSQPTKKDLKKTLSVLKDFGIKLTLDDIPLLNSIYDLENWQRSIIKKKLYCA